MFVTCVVYGMYLFYFLFLLFLAAVIADAVIVFFLTTLKSVSIRIEGFIRRFFKK